MKNAMWMGAVGISAILTISISTVGVNIDDNGYTELQMSDCGGLQGMKVPASMIGLPTSGAIVQTATPVDGRDEGNDNGEFCKVIGIIKPVNPKSQNIEFEVNLPAKWNNRVLQMGGGGYNGSLVDGLAGYTLQPENEETPLKKGYVTLGSDGGHKSTWAFDGRFGLDDEALLNFGKESIKKAHDAASVIIQNAYGRNPARFYFIGGSQGGHEALDAAARYPEDYDGVVSHYPAYNVTMLHLASLNVGRALYSNGGAGWINPQKTKLITDAVYAECDRLDGAQDSIIGNVNGCNTVFDITTLRCRDGVDSGNACLSDAQIEAVQKIASDYKPGFEIAGSDTFPRWPLLEGARFQVSTFGLKQKPNPSSSDVATATSNGLLYSVGEQTVKYIITRNPDEDAMAFDEKQWKERITEVASMMDVTSVSLEKFRAKGGKIILTHGTMDDFITPHNSVAYYERQVQQFTQPVVDTFIRFYMIPGFGHGFGSFDARFNSLEVLQNWVENDQAPGQIIAIDKNPGANRSRPLCPWPNWPKFTGDAGTENDPASYTCVME